MKKTQKIEPAYPKWVCETCAAKATTRSTCCATYHMDICDCCNEWKCVTAPRDYGNPKLVAQYDLKKILKNLDRVKQFYIENGENYNALQIAEKMEEILKELQETVKVDKKKI